MMPPRRSPAATTHASPRALGMRLRHIAEQHRDCLWKEWCQLLAQPLDSLLLLFMIALALALPATLHLLLQRAAEVGIKWQQPPQLTVYMVPDSSPAQWHELQQYLADEGLPESVLHTPQQALQQMEALLDLPDLLAGLEENPLPATLLITIPNTQQQQTLLQQLRQHPTVAKATAEGKWVQRLQGLLTLLQRFTQMLFGLLLLALLVVVYNSIRLDFQGRQREVEVLRMVGASGAFIRRPFLYRGFLYGLIGAKLACLLLWLNLYLLSAPINTIALLYGQPIPFSPLRLVLELAPLLLAAAAALGIMGAWLAIAQKMYRVKQANR